MPATAPAAAPAAPVVPLGPQPQQPSICSSPQKRMPSPVNAPVATVDTAPAAAAMAAGSPRAAPSPRPAPGSPKAAATATVPVAAVEAVRPNGSLSDAEFTQIRRLLMPGALASTLASCAAAASAATTNNGTAAATSAATAADTCSGEAAGSAPSVEPAGRTGQFKELCSLVSECCSSGRGTAVYISGLPGTGKTYTVSRLLSSLPMIAASCGGGVGRASFCCATINCMTLDDPAQLYGRLQNELLRAATAADSGTAFCFLQHNACFVCVDAGTVLQHTFELCRKSCTQNDIPDVPTPTDATAAHESLVATLSKLSLVHSTMVSGAAGKGVRGAAKGSRAKSAKRGRNGAEDAAGHEDEAPMRRVFVVVLDEVDRLLRRRDGGEELVRLFQLPTTPGLSLVLLSVANSLDLTERMMPLLRVRGMAPRHLVFTAYSRPQVLAILSAQLSAHPRGRRCFDDAALDMVAKSISSSSGDLRQALKACRTALDVLMEHNRANPATARASVGIREVHAALQRMSSQGNGQPAVVAKIKGLPPQQQLALLALATAVGTKAAAAGGEGGGAMFQPGSALFTGSRPKFADAVAFREIGNQEGPLPAASSNPGACFDGPTPSKPGRPGAAAAATPSVSRVRGVMGPGGAAALTPSSCARGPPPSRTPASILAGDAGLALGLAEVYTQYGALCRQLDIPAMSESAFRTDALVGLDCDGLLRVTEGRTPAATRLSLRVMSAGDAIPLPSYELPGTPAELTACINTHQPDIKGTTWTDAMRDQPTYFKVVGMWWSRKRADVPVTITTQLSWNRKWQLKAMCRSWAGPIAAVMHMPVLLPRLTRSRDAALGDVSNATLQRAVNTVAAFHARLDASQPCKLDLMLLAEPYREGKSLVLYPVNTLRNYARLMARTPIIGLVDVDLIVSSSLRSELLNATAAATYVTEATTAAAAAAAGEAAPLFATGDSRLDGVPAALATQLNLSLATIGLEGRHGRRQRAAWILPAFETRSGSVTLQVERAEKLAAAGNKSRLLPYFQHGKVLRFDWGSTGHKNTDYSKWFNTTEPYVVEWSGRYEPWVVVDRLSSSWADARFRGYGKNKIIHIRTLAYEGYELRVHPFAFLIHRPHLESSSAFAHARGALNGKKSKASSMYGHNVNLYKSIEVSMAYGNYTPVVDPATAACRATLSWWRRQASGGVR
ncbi:hypothetical protein VOLCADRAFT_108086 [Volvox carteri f. nagariensis]|uniref:AAA+ ATPase domain-containing protein n=1 Tax=Volvox carteri f. nagariensis TaxID=3068 RepID=D8UI36_VOLCA|nr:uncharacterized protein VOLCADRAFT_108086 [Volvox carteri f. nagariensis]EFJ40603.1 hypothetical protein VOLCADRAFT_108086 [Volvox carteri f. nagariensis]|eukprot:XP_002958310.1 hypothetical protein VOLCADRAFT_108086 [Volvox carteri f. nagariensis]